MGDQPCALLDRDLLNAHSSHTIFIAPPEPAPEHDNAYFTYDRMPTQLNMAYFELDRLNAGLSLLTKLFDTFSSSSCKSHSHWPIATSFVLWWTTSLRFECGATNKARSATFSTHCKASLCYDHRLCQMHSYERL